MQNNTIPRHITSEPKMKPSDRKPHHNNPRRATGLAACLTPAPTPWSPKLRHAANQYCHSSIVIYFIWIF
jgi:hypothetical protein